MSTTTKKAKKSGAKDLKNEPIPQLILLKNGLYKVRIPFKYMLIRDTAAWYEFYFKGLINE